MPIHYCILYVVQKRPQIFVSIKMNNRPSDKMFPLHYPIYPIQYMGHMENLSKAKQL